MDDVKVAGLTSNSEFESQKVKDHIKKLAASAVNVDGLSQMVSGAVAHQSVTDRLDIDLGISVNEISEVTGPTDVYFKDVTTPDGRTNPDGMGTLLIVEKGAENLTWPGGTRIHGRPPTDSESFASLVRVSGTVHVIWSAVDSTPPVSGGGSGTVLATLDDVVQGRVSLAPGESVINSESGTSPSWRFANLTSETPGTLTLVDNTVDLFYAADDGTDSYIEIRQGPSRSKRIYMALPGPEPMVPPEPGSGWIILSMSYDTSYEGATLFYSINDLIPDLKVAPSIPGDESTPRILILPFQPDNSHFTINDWQRTANYSLDDLGDMFENTNAIDLVYPQPQEKFGEYGIELLFEYLSPERMAEYSGSLG